MMLGARLLPMRMSVIFLLLFAGLFLHSFTDGLQITIDSTQDAPANPGDCLAAPNGHCNIRSAWTVCQSTADSTCTINIPPRSRLAFDSSLGSLAFGNSGAAEVQIQGNGATVESGDQSGSLVSRFITINRTEDHPMLRFSLFNLSLVGFGGLNLTGGTVSVTGNVDVTLQAIQCSLAIADSGACLSVQDNQIGSVTVTDSVFSQTQVWTAGGALAFHNSQSITIQSCTFNNISSGWAGDGGAVFFYNTAVVSVVSSQFSHCDSHSYGAGILLQDNNREVTVDDCSFYDMQAVVGGSIALLRYNQDVTLSNLLFDSSVASVSLSSSANPMLMSAGGAIASIFENDRVTVRDIVASNCLADYGGVVATFNSTQVSLTALSLSSSIAQFDGGAIYHALCMNCSIADAWFWNVSAEMGSGGAVFFAGMGELFLHNLTATLATSSPSPGMDNIDNVNETAGIGGGAIDIQVLDTWQGYPVAVQLHNITLSQVSGTSGGGIMLQSLRAIDLRQVTVTQGFALNHGGCLFVDVDPTLLDQSSVMQDVTLVNCEAAGVGGGLVIYRGHFAVKRVNITNSRASVGGAMMLYKDIKYTTVRQLYVNKAIALFAGGAMFIYEVINHLSISESVFNDTSAEYVAGAILIADKYSDIDIVDSEFLHSNSSHGGGIVLSGFGSNVNIQRVSFRHFLAFQAGAAITAGFVYNVTVQQSLFEHMSTQAYGGAILSLGSMTINQCTFQDVSAHTGGAIYMSGSIVIKESIFRNISATLHGGALAGSLYNSTISSNVFEGIAAGQSGGAVYLSGQQVSSIEILDNTFTTCEAGLNGGGVFLGPSVTDIHLTGNTFTNCNAGLSGGGLYLSPALPDIHLIGSTFTNNTAMSSGGAVYLGIGLQRLIVGDTRAGQRAFVVESPHPYTTVVPFETLLDVPDATGYIIIFDSQTSLKGNDRIDFIDGDANFFFVGYSMTSAFPGSRAPPLVLNVGRVLVRLRTAGGGSPTQLSDNVYGFSMRVIPLFISPSDATVLRSNSAPLGGGIYVDGSLTNAVFANVNFFENRATGGSGSSPSQYGGALYLRTANPGLVFARCQFTSNWADSDGGAVYMTAQYGVQFAFCAFNQNSARRNGGAIILQVSNGVGSFAENNAINFYQTEFRDNEATGYQGSSGSGGAIYLANTNTIQLLTCFLTGNRAAKGDGGAIYSSDANTLTLQSTQIDGNLANNGGAMSSSTSNSWTVIDSYFRNNVATKSGGALSQQQNTALYLDADVYFMNNSAVFGGALAITAATLYASSTAQVVFERNVAAYGAAIAITSLRDSTNALDNTIIRNNTAYGAGIIYWVYSASYMATEPTGLRSPTLTFGINTVHDTEISTEDIATQPIRMESSVASLTTAYDEVLSVPIELTLIDYYGHQVPVTAQVPVTMSTNISSAAYACHNSLPRLSTDRVTTAFTDKVYRVQNFRTSCYPGGTAGVIFSADSSSLTYSSLYSDTTVEHGITLHFRTCVAGEYVTDNTCASCPDGSYRLTAPASQSDTCHSCLSKSGAASCSGQTIVTASGHWRRYDSVDTILPCFYGSHSCIGGNSSGDSLCRVGYKGPLCAVCEDGYFPDGQRCISCEDQTARLTPSVIFYLTIGGVVLVAIVLVLVSRYLTDHADMAGDAVDTYQNGLLGSLYRPMKLLFSLVAQMYAQIMVKLKIVIATIQVVISTTNVFSIRWPAAFNTFTNAFQLINLNIPVFSIRCSRDFDFVDKLIAGTLIPIGIALCILIAFLVHRTVYYVQHRHDAIYSKYISSAVFDENLKQNLGQLRHRYFNYFLFLTYLVLPSVTTLLFQMFVCTDIDPNGESPGEDHLYLTADTSISCTSDRFKFGAAYAGAMIAVYPVGIPLMYFILLYRSRNEIQQRPMPHKELHASANRHDLAKIQPQPVPFTPVNSQPGANDHGFSPEPSPVCVDDLHREKVRVYHHNEASEEGEEGDGKENDSMTKTMKTTKTEDRGDFEAAPVSVSVLPRHVERLSFLWESYQPSFWYWEIIETSRRLIFTAILSVCARGTAAQNILSILLSLFFINLYGHCLPYHTADDNTIAEVGQYQIFLTFFCALILQNDLLTGVYWNETIGGLLVAVNLAVCVLFLRQVHRAVQRELRSRRRAKEEARQREVALMLVEDEEQPVHGTRPDHTRQHASAYDTHDGIEVYI